MIGTGLPSTIEGDAFSRCSSCCGVRFGSSSRSLAAIPATYDFARGRAVLAVTEAESAQIAGERDEKKSFAIRIGESVRVDAVDHQPHLLFEQWKTAETGSEAHADDRGLEWRRRRIERVRDDRLQRTGPVPVVGRSGPHGDDARVRRDARSLAGDYGRRRGAVSAHNDLVLIRRVRRRERAGTRVSLVGKDDLGNHVAARRALELVMVALHAAVEQIDDGTSSDDPPPFVPIESATRAVAAVQMPQQIVRKSRAASDEPLIPHQRTRENGHRLSLTCRRNDLQGLRGSCGNDEEDGEEYEACAHFCKTTPE